MPGAAWLDRVPQVLRVPHDAMAMLRLHSPSLCSETTRILREEVEEAQRLVDKAPTHVRSGPGKAIGGDKSPIFGADIIPE